MPKKVYVNTSELEQDTEALIKYISSDRSDGKTTAFARIGYDEFKRSGKIGVYLRRFVNEITSLTVETFITNLRKVRNTGELTYKGSAKKSGIHVYENGKEFAVFVPLSRAGQVKSAFDCETHKNLYFDEYIPLDRRYLPDEPSRILELFRTIDRDTWESCIWVASNHVTNYSPLFEYFGITPRNGISRWKNGRFLLLQVANKGNREQVKLSPLGELVRGTTYETYTQGGTLEEFGMLIHREHTKAREPFLVKGSNSALYGFYWCDAGLVIDRAEKKAGEPIFGVLPANGADGVVYIKSDAAKELYRTLQQRIYLSQVFVASEKIFEETKDIFKIFRAA